MTKEIGILGSTGSIGRQALDVVREFPSEFTVSALSAHTSMNLLKEQATEFSPDTVAISDPVEDPPDEWIRGREGLLEIASMDLDLLVLAIVGAAGVEPCLRAIETGTDIAFANKEVLVTAGNLVRRRLEDSETELIPVDSEHSALMQLLQDEDNDDVTKLILTASGGPFLNHSLEELQNVTPEDALDHPNWDMGPKITVDSATMMNKGLEVIEALHLFDFPPNQVDAIIHPQSMVHGLIELTDNSVKAHCSEPDMKLAIQYALFYPEHRESLVDSVDFSVENNWEFRPIDRRKFPCFDLAVSAAESGSTAPVLLNASNEVAVEAFLDGQISFRDIPKLIENCLESVDSPECSDLESIMEVDRQGREFTRRAISGSK